jgi:hypothetical protein
MSGLKSCALTIVGVIGLACAHQSAGTVFNAVPWPAAVIPQYNVDSVTRDSASIGAYALVGTVVDSAVGKPLESVQVQLRQWPEDRRFYAYTDSRGGFVLGRVPPGRYDLVIRVIGYRAVTEVRDARAGVVDTLRTRMAVHKIWLSAL